MILRLILKNGKVGERMPLVNLDIISCVKVSYTVIPTDIEEQSQHMDGDSSMNKKSLDSQRDILFKRKLFVSVSSDAGSVIEWSPELHAILHYEFSDFLSVFKKESTDVSSNAAHHSELLPSEYSKGDGSDLTKPYLGPLLLDIALTPLSLRLDVNNEQNVILKMTPFR